eukprot:1798819-Rhodomonas_salina.2
MSTAFFECVGNRRRGKKALMGIADDLRSALARCWAQRGSVWRPVAAQRNRTAFVRHFSTCRVAIPSSRIDDVANWADVGMDRAQPKSSSKRDAKLSRRTCLSRTAQHTTAKRNASERAARSQQRRAGSRAHHSSAKRKDDERCDGWQGEVTLTRMLRMTSLSPDDLSAREGSGHADAERWAR